jgi:B-block binding subunit of TFIIIC
VSTKDLTRFVGIFYSKRGTGAESENVVVYVPDEKLLDTVWGWLRVHPDVWVGRNRQGNRFTFSELEAHQIREAQRTKSPETQVAEPSVSGTRKGKKTAKKTASPAKSLPAGRDPLRIFTTIDRIWQAVAGHPVDAKRIPPMEFHALCAIATAGEAGIAQPDLTRMTGQDKRSLPRRTEVLAKNGYIEKTPMFVKHHKTSLLRHKRYCKGGIDIRNAWSSARFLENRIFDNKSLSFNNFINWLCEQLKNDNVLTIDDMHMTLELTEDMKWERRAIWRSLERLEVAGIVARFRARSDLLLPSGGTRYLNCVKLLKVPTEADLKVAHTLSMKDRKEYRRKLEAQKANDVAERRKASVGDADHEATQNDVGEEEGIENDGGEEIEESIPVQDMSTNLPANEESEKQTDPVISLEWDPDALYPNLVQRVVKKAGTAGARMIVSFIAFAIVRQLTGSGYTSSFIWAILRPSS